MTETSLPLTDPTRAVLRHGEEVTPTRSLPTHVWAPLTPGQLPLIVFAHGYGLGPEKYARFCHALAAAGFLVAAPSFPLADPARGDGLDRGDIPNEAGDVSFVITALLHSPLAAHVDPRSIAVVGHSDGADAALMVGYQVGKADPRVDAIVAIDPDAMSGRVAETGAPLLLVHGTGDTVVAYSNARHVFAQVPVRRYFLTLLGAGHVAPIVGGTTWTNVLDTAVVTFLEATVLRRETGDGLAFELSQLDHSRLAVAG